VGLQPEVPGGTGWYRKSFTVATNLKGKIFLLQFDGIYMNTDVWLNGKKLGNHPYGYTSFWYDITDKIIYGETNIIAVKVMNEEENSRWYSGSGIYRHVWLKTIEPVHIAQWGTCITTPEVTATRAKVNLKIQVENETSLPAKIKIVSRIISSKGFEISRTESEQTIDQTSSYEFNHNIELKSPELWSTETPSLYTAISEIYQNADLKDYKETKFGLRTISLDIKNGFRLNGQTVKLKGGCLHHDNGPLGAKAFDRAEERRIEILKASGYNTVRTAHNPPSPAFLDACDRLGMLVIDEAFDMWSEPKNPHDYHLYFDQWWQKDIESMVLRDRNHPSIIMWSIGNEIPGMHKPEVVEVAKMLSDFIRNIEPSRPITAAVNGLRPDKDPYFAALDVAGYNYAAGGDHNKKSLYAHDHTRLPNRIMYGAESYPLEAFGSWMDVLDNPYVIGDFVWTAFDYIGEASIGWRGYPQEANFYPWNLAFCGDIDICGWKRPQSYYRDALWKENQLSLFVTPPQPSFELNPKRKSWSKWHWLDAVADWNWKGSEDKTLTVSAYSSCDEVELFLNNNSLGKKPTKRSTQYMASWQVSYQPGKLKAVGYKGKKQIALSELQSAKESTQIKISADRTELKANGQDLSYITVELTDTDGIRNPKAENLVEFEIEGPGTIIGVGNANPISLESYQLPKRKAWRGKCMVIVKSLQKTGEIALKASSTDLKSAEVKINIR
jgi:beta-galactosidase